MKDRIRRYKDKISYIVHNIEAIQNRPENELELAGVLYKLHTSIEAVMDIIAMLLKDTGEGVEDDYTNIHRLKEIGIIPAGLAAKLTECNGLRNHLVHRYNSVDDTIAMESICEVHEIVYQFIEIVEELLIEFEKNEN